MTGSPKKDLKNNLEARLILQMKLVHLKRLWSKILVNSILRPHKKSFNVTSTLLSGVKRIAIDRSPSISDGKKINL